MEAAIGSQYAVFGSQEAKVLESTPPEDWMVEQQLAAKRAEEKMAACCDGELFVAQSAEEKTAACCNRELFVAKHPRAACQIVVAEAAAAEEVKAMVKPAAAEKKTKLVRVKQAYIDSLLMCYPKKPLVPFPEELIQTISPEKRNGLRAVMAKALATLKSCRDEDEEILRQYHAKGYAEMEVEDRDDEEEI